MATTDLPLLEMSEVHAALRRDFARAHALLRSPRHLTSRHRDLLGRHVVFLVHNLHHHHEGEDEHLWPELLRRNPELAPLLKRMDADHVTIQGPMEDLEHLGAAFSSGEASAEELDAAITRLEDALLPHLAAEEGEAMPQACALLSEADWNRMANKAWRRGPLRDGAFACNWLLDNANATGRALFHDGLPAPIRFLFYKVFHKAYAERRRELWEGTPAEGVPTLSVQQRLAWQPG